MNERIKELYQQSANQDYFPRDNEEVYMSAKGLEKFAELIVRECAWIANDPAPSVYDHDSYKLGRKWASEDVLRHFGVEE